jgi:hypothetical protein
VEEEREDERECGEREREKEMMGCVSSFADYIVGLG